MSQFFQWFIRIFLSALVSLPISGYLASLNPVFKSAIPFFVSVAVITLVLHFISKIPILTKWSPFKKYIIAFFGLILLAIVTVFAYAVVGGLRVANNIGDSSGCEKLGDYKDGCYYNYATAQGDISICEKITSVDWKNKCYAYASIKAEKSYCDKINGGDDAQTYGDKTACYQHFALKNKDISLCDNIPFYSWYTGRYGCYQQVIVVLQDPTLCSKIPDVNPTQDKSNDTIINNSLKQLKSDCLILKKTYNN